MLDFKPVDNFCSFLKIATRIELTIINYCRDLHYVFALKVFFIFNEKYYCIAILA